MEDRFAAQMSGAPQALCLLLSFWGLLQHVCNSFNNSIDIAYHFEVPESQYGVTASAQDLAPAFVLLFLVCVLANHQLR